MEKQRRVVMMGSTGAVGGYAAATLASMPEVARLTLLGRRPTDLDGPTVEQHTVDAMQPDSYAQRLKGHDVAVCTLGVGDPSKVDRETFVRIDKQVVLDFAAASKAAGVQHFELLASVGVDSGSRSFYLRTKGELEDGLRDLQFERLSLFHPSMILTPTNRYGWTQALTLRVWPWLTPVLLGGLRKYRGIAVATLGAAMARNVVVAPPGEQTLEWDEFIGLAGAQA